jgi:hypothetical protein
MILGLATGPFAVTFPLPLYSRSLYTSSELH